MRSGIVSHAVRGGSNTVYSDRTCIKIECGSHCIRECKCVVVGIKIHGSGIYINGIVSIGSSRSIICSYLLELCGLCIVCIGCSFGIQ